MFAAIGTCLSRAELALQQGLKQTGGAVVLKKIIIISSQCGRSKKDQNLKASEILSLERGNLVLSHRSCASQGGGTG